MAVAWGGAASVPSADAWQRQWSASLYLVDAPTAAAISALYDEYFALASSDYMLGIDLVNAAGQLRALIEGRPAPATA